MLNKEREERKKRRDSLTRVVIGEEGSDSIVPSTVVPEDEEFSKPMMYLFDDNELQERKKEQMYGNMYLLTELFIAK